MSREIDINIHIHIVDFSFYNFVFLHLGFVNLIHELWLSNEFVHSMTVLDTGRDLQDVSV